MIPNSMMVRDLYDATEEVPHNIRVIVNGYEVPCHKASAVGRWAELVLIDSNEVVLVDKVDVEYLWGAPLTSMDNGLSAAKFLAGRGPEPDPRKVRRWASYAKE